MEANLHQGPLPCEEALSCPFCGHKPEIQPWHGGGPAKKMISCSHEDCHVGPQVSGPNRKMAVRRWNTRTTSLQVEASQALKDGASGYSDAHLLAFARGGLDEDGKSQDLTTLVKAISRELYLRRAAMGETK